MPRTNFETGSFTELLLTMKLSTPQTTPSTTCGITKSIPPEKSEAYIALMLQVAPLDMPGPSREKIFEIVEKIPSRERFTVMELSRQLFGNKATDAQRIETITTVRGLNAKIRGDIIRAASSVISPEMDTLTRCTIVEAAAAAAVSTRERDDFIDLTCGSIIPLLCTTAMPLKNRIAIVQAVVKVPAEERADVIAHTHTLITPAMDSEQRIAILKTVAKVLSDERAFAEGLKADPEQAQSEPFPDDSKDPKSIETMQHSLSDERAFAAKLAATPEPFPLLLLPLDEGFFDDCKKAPTLESVSPKQETAGKKRSDVIEKATLLITSEMTYLDRIMLIKTIAKADPDERPLIVEQVRNASSATTSSLTRCTIIEAALSVPLPQRPDFIHLTLKSIIPLLTNLVQPDLMDSVIIIRAIASYPPETRADIITQAHRLITLDMPSYERKTIVCNVAAISANERSDIITQALKLITSGMSVYERMEIVQSIKRAPVNERAAIVELAQNKISFGMRAQILYTMLDAAALVPARERSDFMDLTLQFIIPELIAPENMTNTALRIQTLKAVAAIPARDRYKIRRHTEEIRSSALVFSERIAVLQSLFPQEP